MATEAQLKAIAEPMIQFSKGTISFYESLKQIRAILDPDGVLSDRDLRAKVLELQPLLEKYVGCDCKTRVVEVEVSNPDGLEPIGNIVEELAEEKALLILKIYRTSDSKVQTELIIDVAQADEALVDIARLHLNEISAKLAEKA